MYFDQFRYWLKNLILEISDEIFLKVKFFSRPRTIINQVIFKQALKNDRLVF
jgi:hypothetical protein